ncbi:MAG: hypothetical protein ACREXR_22910, partial [Gammaproteobacteria bacterium]
YDDLSRTVRLLESVLLKYKRLRSAEGPTTLLPTWQYNWKQVFHVPWISNANAVPSGHGMSGRRDR